MDSKRPPELILCAVIVGYLACTVPILNWWPPLSYDECWISSVGETLV